MSAPKQAGGLPEGPDDFDPVARCYDWFPVPTHPKRLAPFLRAVRGTVLDLGGGTGKYSVRMLDPERHRIVLVDPAVKMLERARRAGRPVETMRAVGQRLPFQGDSVAAVVATEAFHHFGTAQRETVREVARVLRPDGLFLVEEPDPGRLLGRMMAWGEKVQKMTSVFHAPGELERMLAECFQDVTTKRTGWLTYCALARGPRER